VKRLVDLTDLQLSILNVLWDGGEASVAEVHDALAPGLARKTVGTLLARLEHYGVVAHRTRGREFVYRACVSRDEVRAARLKGLAEMLFAGDTYRLLSFALADEGISASELERLRAIVESHRPQAPPGS
jgi:predicted transcriptional regulator